MKKNIIAIMIITVSALICNGVFAKEEINISRQVMHSLKLPLLTLYPYPAEQNRLHKPISSRKTQSTLVCLNKRLQYLSHQVHYWSMKIKQEFVVAESGNMSTLISLCHQPTHLMQLSTADMDQITPAPFFLK